jgi:hypothetical protein
MMRFAILMLSAVLLFLFGCAKKSKLPDEPQISFNPLIYDTISIIESDSEQKQIILSFSYSVKNGEIAAPKGSSGNLILTDNRTGDKALSFTIPTLKGVSKYDAEKGIIDVVITKNDIKANGTASIDILNYDVILIDKNKKQSNIVKAGPIYVKQF